MDQNIELQVSVSQFDEDSIFLLTRFYFAIIIIYKGYCSES